MSARVCVCVSMWLFFGLFYLTPFALIPIGIYFPEQNCSVALQSVYMYICIFMSVYFLFSFELPIATEYFMHCVLCARLCACVY